MLGYKHRDPAIQSRARDQAAWLVRDHGDEAEAVLRAKMNRKNLSKDDEYRFKLTGDELEKIRVQMKLRREGRCKKPGLVQRIFGKLNLRRASDPDD